MIYTIDNHEHEYIPGDGDMGTPLECSLCGLLKTTIESTRESGKEQSLEDILQEFERDVHKLYENILSPEMIEQTVSYWKPLINKIFSAGERSGRDTGRGEIIRDSQGFIREAMVPKEAFDRIRTETAREIIESIDKLPSGHTPDGKHHWVSVSDLGELKEEIQLKYLKGENND